MSRTVMSHVVTQYGWGGGGAGEGGNVGNVLPRLWQKKKKPLYESISAEKRHVLTNINASKARPNDCLLKTSWSL